MSRHLKLLAGDLWAAEPLPEPRLREAFRVLGEYQHRVMGKAPRLRHPEASKDSCVWSCLTARDFLQWCGFRAEAVPAICVLMAQDPDGKPLRQVCIGSDPDKPPDLTTDYSAGYARWSGHMVVLVDGWLLDPTLFMAKRPEWKWLPGMIAIRQELSDGPLRGGRRGLAGFGTPDHRFGAVWLEDPENTAWEDGDARRGLHVKSAQKLRRYFRAPVEASHT